MKLNHRVLGNGEPLIILHGLFGSLDNWMTLAKQLATSRKVYLVDQRNHGKSPHDEQFNYEVMAADLKEFIGDHCEETPDVLGHSMGGKTVMNAAVLYPELIRKMIVVDIAPKSYPVHHEAIIEALRSLPLEEVKTRKEADDFLADKLPRNDVRQFLLKNLYRQKDNSFGWKMNLEAIAENIEQIGEGLAPNAVFDGEVLFIGGSKSDYIVPDRDRDIIHQHFPNSQLKMVEGAGHWVHAEKPKELLELVESFLGSS